MALVRLATAPGETPSGTPDAATEPAISADTSWTVGAFALIVAGWAIGWLLWKWLDPAGFAPAAESSGAVAAAGISVFAPLYIFAQSIERLLEPFSSVLARAKDDDGTVQSKSACVMKRNKAIASEDAQATAEWQRIVDRVRRNTAVITWGIASFLGMTVSGAFGIFLMQAAGFDVSALWDVGITGLAIGSGTKPLHDLISNTQKSKEEKQNPSVIDGVP